MKKNNPIESAIPFLKNNLHKIYTVTEWAHAMGYSRGYFTVRIKDIYKEPPFVIIKKEKYKKIEKLVHENPDKKGRTIANNAGFADVKALYKFLKYHYDINLSEMREATK